MSTFSVHSSRRHEARRGGPYCSDIVGIKMAWYSAWLKVSDEELAWWRRGRTDVQGRFWQITFCLDHNLTFPARTKAEKGEILSMCLENRVATNYFHLIKPMKPFRLRKEKNTWFPTAQTDVFRMLVLFNNNSPKLKYNFYTNIYNKERLQILILFSYNAISICTCSLHLDLYQKRVTDWWDMSALMCFI